MPLPSTKITHVEIHFQGLVAAGGSTNRLVDNVFHYRRTGVSLPILKSGIDTAFQANAAVPLAAALNARFTQTGNQIRFINDPLDPPQGFPHALPGLRAGDSMSVQMAAYVLLRTAVRGRSYRGSKHFFPISEVDSTAGTDDVFNAAAIALWATFLAAYVAGFTDAQGNTWVPCVVSRKLSNLTRTPEALVVANDVSNVSLNKKIGVMRHRSPRSQY